MDYPSLLIPAYLRVFECPSYLALTRPGKKVAFTRYQLVECVFVDLKSTYCPTDMYGVGKCMFHIVNC
jgi:hypothetical protein